MDKTIDQLLMQLTSAHMNFIQVAHQLSSSKRYESGVCGEWSPKDVVSHLAGWDKSLKELIVTPHNFNPPYDVHNFNARSVASRKDLNWEDVIDELETNFQDLEQALATVEPEMNIYRPVINWLPGRREDYELHTGQLEAWLV